MRLLVVSDVHYACDAEIARRGHEARAAGNPVLAATAKAWRSLVWLRDPFGHNHRLAQILAAEPDPDLVVGNGDLTVDSAYVGVSDDAAAESARWVLSKLRAAYGDRFFSVIGDHDLGKMSLFGGIGGPRWASWVRATGELGLAGVWRRDVGRYSLVGAPSTPLSLPLFDPELLPAEKPRWTALATAVAEDLSRIFAALERDRKVVLFIHDPSALPFLSRIPAVTERLGQIERTVVGHLHSPAIFRLASALSGAPRVTGLGQTLRRYTLALREARCWRAFRTHLCPSPNGIQLLKDGGYLRLALDPEARRPLILETVHLPWSTV